MLSQTKSLIKSFFQKEVVQLSPPRSGSTLLWNSLCFYNHYAPRKIHNFNDLNKRLNSTKLFISVRNPLDIVCSLIKIEDKEFNFINIEKSVIKLKDLSIDIYPKIKNKNNCIFFKYEDFYENINYILEILDKLFGEKSIEDKKHFKENFSIEKIKERYSDNNNFKHYDQTTFFHGKHISESNGLPNSYKKYLSQSDVDYITENFQSFMKSFGYL